MTDIDDLLAELGEFEMDPAFKRQLRESLRSRSMQLPEAAQRSQPTRPTRRATGTALSAALAGVLLVGFSVMVFWLQANAASGPRFFQEVQAERLPEFETPPEPADLPGGSLWRNLTLAEARQAASFTLLEPAVPPGWRYAGAQVSAGGAVVTLNYRPDRGTLAIVTQQLRRGPGPDRLPVGDQTTVQRVQIGDQTAEYVEGAWNQPLEPLPIFSVDDMLEAAPYWDAATEKQTLRWQHGRYLLTLQIEPALSQQAIIQLAEELYP
ncbi:MAG: hypothetical protein GYB64_14070 [Chloroflexi bacterium]|nr:hypothetical protein [Chloroflexota bacterium]